MASLTFEEWLQTGLEEGWCSPPVCATHAGVPSTEEENAAWEAGEDPCQHVLRLWPQD